MRGSLIVFFGAAALLCGLSGGPVRGEAYATANFRVECVDPALARDGAERAEECRMHLWQYWTGSPPPGNWPQPCRVTVRIGHGSSSGGGSTSIAHEILDFEGTWDGSRAQLLECVVPHEVNHTVVATIFGKEFSRALDEGMATSVEAKYGRDVWREEIIATLTSRKS